MIKFIKAKYSLFIKGLLMGTADIIPGISGGTVALITNIYKELIAAIASFKLYHIKSFFHLIIFFQNEHLRKKSLDEIKKIHWSFLIPLGLGIVLAILIMSRIIPDLLENYRSICYAIFFGFIAYSVAIPIRHTKINTTHILLFLMSGMSMYYLIGASNLTGNTNIVYIFFSGFLAISAMILPGISGSYILVILGEYEIILTALRHLEFNILIPFILGVVIGILSFIRLLKYLLDKYLTYVMAILSGMILGSLRSIWPFTLKESDTIYSSEYILWHIVLILTSFVFALFIDFIYHKKNSIKDNK